MEKPKFWRTPKNSDNSTHRLGDPDGRANPLSLQRQIENAQKQSVEDFYAYSEAKGVAVKPKYVPVHLDELGPKDRRERLRRYRSISHELRKRTRDLT